jgi:hypothetical protein
LKTLSVHDFEKIGRQQRLWIGRIIKPGAALLYVRQIGWDIEESEDVSAHGYFTFWNNPTDMQKLGSVNRL